MPTEIEVLARREIPSPEESRVGKMDRVIVYRRDSDPRQTFHVRVPLEQVADRARTEQERIEKEAIQQAEDERTSSPPTRFTLES